MSTTPRIDMARRAGARLIARAGATGATGAAGGRPEGTGPPPVPRPRRPEDGELGPRRARRETAPRRRPGRWWIPACAGAVVIMTIGAIAGFQDDGREAGQAAGGRVPAEIIGTPPSGASEQAATDGGATPQDDGAPPEGRVRPETVIVPSIGVTSRLVDLGLEADSRIEVPSDPAVAGFYRPGPVPGTTNSPPALVVGRIDSRQPPAVFARLRELRKGAEVLVRRTDGRTQVFRITKVSRFPKREFPFAAAFAPTREAELRLIGAAGPFGRDTYAGDVVVHATLVGGR